MTCEQTFAILNPSSNSRALLFRDFFLQGFHTSPMTVWIVDPIRQVTCVGPKRVGPKRIESKRRESKRRESKRREVKQCRQHVKVAPVNPPLPNGNHLRTRTVKADPETQHLQLPPLRGNPPHPIPQGIHGNACSISSVKDGEDPPLSGNWQISSDSHPPPRLIDN